MGPSQGEIWDRNYSTGLPTHKVWGRSKHFSFDFQAFQVSKSLILSFSGLISISFSIFLCVQSNGVSYSDECEPTGSGDIQEDPMI